MIDRTALEQREAASIAPYGMRSGESRGRVYLENEHDYRTGYQRDRDRIIHTTAFRRLEYKTQVFVYSEGDHYRNRLTHSIEVAQIGRTLARSLGCNEDLIEAICLAHDLGHPPFGHVGEDTLNRLMQNHGGYDHQKQTYRIITQLEKRYPEHLGLNLTYEVREGVVKHDTDYDIVDASEYEPAERGTLECQLSNLADETAYNTSDLDDGLRSGVLNPQDVCQLELAQRILHGMGEAANADLTDNMLRYRFIRRMVGTVVTDTITATAQKLEEKGVRSLADLRNLPENVATYSSEMIALEMELKKYLFKNFYRHYRVVRMASKAERLLSQLFHAYTGEPQMLPTAIQRQVHDPTDERAGDLHRIVCDYLAGMTDRYAIQEHKKLFDHGERV